MNTTDSKQPEPPYEAEREAGFAGAHGSADAPDFRSELCALINKHSMENGSNTPDFILAQYLTNCLRAWNQATQQRETWYGRDARPTSPPNTKISNAGTNAGTDSSTRCAVSLDYASDILADMLDDPNDNGDYRLTCSGMSLALLWESIQKQEQELHELRKDKARLDSGEIIHRCCGDRVHFVKQDLRAAIDEALSQNA